MFAGQLNTNVTTDSGMTVEMKEFYDKQLIRLAKANLVHDQFAQIRNIPKNGGKTIEFRKFDPIPKSLTPLTEGVTPDGRKATVTNLTATVEQYGDYITVSDVLDMTAIDNTIVELTGLMADAAGRTMDTITRDALAAGTNVIYANNKASRNALTASDTLKPIMIEQAATQLKRHNAKPINGSYVAIIHPEVSHDLRTSAEWIDVHKYTDSSVNAIYEGEIGKLGNVRFVESTEAKIWKDDTCPSGLAVYSTLVVADNAYATTSVEGGGLRTIIKQLGSAGTADPLDQRATIGYKALKVSEILVENYMVRIETTSSYSDITEAN